MAFSCTRGLKISQFKFPNGHSNFQSVGIYNPKNVQVRCLTKQQERNKQLAMLLESVLDRLYPPLDMSMSRAGLFPSSPAKTCETAWCRPRHSGSTSSPQLAGIPGHFGSLGSLESPVTARSGDQPCKKGEQDGTGEG